MNNKQLPKDFGKILFIPLIILVIMILFNSFSEMSYSVTLSFQGVLGLSLFFITIYSYISEIKYFKKYYPKRSNKPQLYLIFGSLILIFIGATIGDLLGVMQYGTESSGFGGGAFSGLVIGASISLALLYVMSICNYIFIRNKSTNKFLYVSGYMLYAIGWFAVVVISYFIGAIIYALHDPSTE
jgi:hypothetical protein